MLRTILLCFLLLSSTLYVYADVRSYDAVLQRSAEANVDTQLALHDVELARAALHNVQGKHWHPELRSSFSYTDDQQQPTNPFQSARTQALSWDASLQQSSPLGMRLTAGVSSAWNKYFQAEPVNALLPFPASYHQPAISLQLEVDLLQNALGYITRRNLRKMKLQLEQAQAIAEVAARKSAMAAASLYVQLIGTQHVQQLMRDMLQRLEKLGATAGDQFDRHLLESSDIDRLRALIAARKADLAQLQQQVVAVQESLRTILRLDAATQVRPRESMRHVLARSQQCAAQLDHRKYDAQLSTAHTLAELGQKRARIAAQVTKHSSLPEVTARASIAGTGTDADVGSAFDEARSYDRPVYSLGVDLSWPLSLRRSRAGLRHARAEEAKAVLELEQVAAQKRAAWDATWQRMQFLRREHAHLQQVLGASASQLLALQTQYNQGRISLFQLTEEELQYLQYAVRSTQVAQGQVLANLALLQEFDQLNCTLSEVQP